jgi:predicted TIM-barrel fold metal-dependent hydrolase
LEASRATGVGVIAHGGRSPYVSNSEAVDYGTLDNWKHVDWTITDQPVVIAHAGIFGYETAEAIDHVLPVLSGLLDRNDHLSVDLSGLELDAMVAVLNRIDTDRVLFGSDALYYAQWEAMVRFSRALELSDKTYEESFHTVASLNPSRLVEPGGRRHASVTSH